MLIQHPAASAIGVAMLKGSSDLFGALLILGLLIWLGLRITQGADLSDESYYAIFLITWLKDGIENSPFLTLHQTAALLVYPAAVLFQRATGSTEGLILFLRALYVSGALIAALSAVALFRRAGMRLGGWFAGASVLAFIPFGLPAPSYNTIAEHAAIAALAGCGCAVLETKAPTRARIFWFIFSAMAWAIATVAYPSLLLALVLLYIYPFLVPRPVQPTLNVYVILVLIFQIVAWLTVVEVLTLPRIRDSILYQASIAGSWQVDKKLSFAAEIISQNLWFCLAVVVAILIGTFRTYLMVPITSIAITSLLGALLLAPSTLFLHSHDAVLLAALTGLAIPFVGHQGQRSSARVLALIYSVSLAAGAVTAVTATYPLFAFPVGGFFAAIVAVLWTPSGRTEHWGLPPGAALLGLCIWCSASFYYGESPSDRLQKRERIGEGVYAGLAASEETAQLMRIAKSALGKRLTASEGITVVGRLPGLYLLTTARPRTLLPFPLTAFAQTSGLSATYDYYADPANRPAIVVIYEDPYFQPVNPFGSRFDEWYRLEDQERTPLGTMSIFSRKL
jgi:hypothetical protein